MEEFILKFMAAMFYVIVGGAILVWILNELCEALDALTNSTIEDWIGFVIFILIVTAVALNL
jgi:hypothetical protein